ncbi:DNA polymerase I [Paenibacillus sp. GSMTC-2017]|uniref:DNA polymerase I n=1 Tax=Paenibacillus sp. GSMTC-2017 TaxID=2794350 RepID=UPI0018D81B3F|nr:DNA polymerase I [Paenibacillus sp. GSMTC-2017]MBH5318485.1 DNA polymerase I [Paenibacillus sp. GSMTC-2017]
MDKWMLIDGNSIAYRAFFAMPPLTNSKGQHTNAIFGFTTMLLKLLEEHKPTHVLVAFDAGKITFRHEGYSEYKGGRQKTPPELSEQFPVLKELITSFGIAQFELSGYEADDIIGTLTKQADEKGVKTIVVTGDKDMLQLSSEGVTVAVTRKGVSEVDLYTPESIQEKYGLVPLQIIDLKGLMGDTSDNIPGVPGIGEKTGLKLLHEYSSVENVLDNLDKLKGKMKENLENHRDDAVMSKKLATIFREVPLERDTEELRYNGFDNEKLGEAFSKLEFKSLMERLGLSAEASGATETEAKAAAAELEITVIDAESDAQLVEALVNKLESSDKHGLYIEAIGENPHHAELIGLSIAVEDKVYVLPYEAVQAPLAEKLRIWLAAEDKPKYGFDLHKAELALRWSGITLGGSAIDVQLGAYLLDPTESALSLSAIYDRNGLYGLPSDESVYGKGAKFKVPDNDVLYRHLALKGDAVRQLLPIITEKLSETGMDKLYFELEQPLSRVLAGMEHQGILVRNEELETLGKSLESQLTVIMSEIHTLAGQEFNIGSPKQLGEILFEKLGLPAKKKTKTGYSTDAEVLEELAPYHDIIPLILHFRQLSKLQSTYVEGLLKEIRKETGKIHTYYRQTIAATGRLSSQFPNLQNIPIRLEEGRQIRKAFVPSEPGWSILAADYSQIELRVLAHISGDENLKEAFINDMDIHTKTAMDVFGVTADQVDSNMRRSAKAVNFGIVYGISDFGLSQNLGITRKEAAQFIEQYFNVFKGVRKYMDDIVAQAKSDGYVTTLLDRRRYLPEIKASNFNLRSFAERTAMNTPIQGTAADIIKLAMVQMDEALRTRGLKSRMLLQVHDELVFEVPADELELMKTLVPEVMSGALKLDVPLKADVSFGDNWYEAK